MEKCHSVYQKLKQNFWQKMFAYIGAQLIAWRVKSHEKKRLFPGYKVREACFI